MTDAITVLEGNRKKLTAKVERLRSQLVAAETELEESETAIRVLNRLGLSPMVEGVTDEGRGNSQARVLSVLPTREAEAKAPRDVHLALIEAGITNITPDNVRTILYRCAKPDASGKALLSTKDSRYWRNDGDEAEVPAIGDDFESLDDEPFIPRPRPRFDDDLDPEVPF